MSAIRSTENRTEELLRKRLFALGLRYRKYHKGLPGRPDIVFVRARVAVFVDGDYWHARILRERGAIALEASMQTPNKQYWISKFSRRVERDAEVSAQLGQAGWKVLRYWETDVKHDVHSIAKEIAAEVRKRQRHDSPGR